MQLIINRSKILISVALSCLLIITWNNSNTVIPDAISVYPEESTESIAIENKITNTVSVAKPITNVLVKQRDTIWTHISQEFQLNHQTKSARVQAEIKKLLADQNRFYKILNASIPYIPYIHKQVQAKNLPAELALIPFIESEFNPNDRSTKGALGLWQLMSGTAKELGLKVKSGQDGRRNVITSTHAALSYFKDLGNNFKGNWYLAIAAYNCGEGRVRSSMRRTGYKNYWDLPLPKETKYYVPRLLAVAAIIKNPTRYGIELPIVKSNIKNIDIEKLAHTAATKKLQLASKYKNKNITSNRSKNRSKSITPKHTYVAKSIHDTGLKFERVYSLNPNYLSKNLTKI